MVRGWDESDEAAEQDSEMQALAGIYFVLFNIFSIYRFTFLK